MRAVSSRPRAQRADVEWAHYKRQIFLRASGCCEVPECIGPIVDGHHTQKPRRAHHDTAIGICRRHHELIDAPMDRGRLVIELVKTSDDALLYRFAQPMLGWERYRSLARLEAP